MEEKNIQKREKMSTVIKIVNAVLCVGIIASVCVNVYQSKESSTLRSEIAALQSDMETLETDRDTLNKEIESKQTTVSDLSLQIEDLQKKIEQLVADNRGLSDSLQALDDGINSTHTDVILGDDEYKGDTGADALQSEYDSLSEEEQEMVDQIVEDMMKEHPEWFAETSDNNNKAPGYVSVDAPVDSGELPIGNLDMSGSSDVPPGIVY